MGDNFVYVVAMAIFLIASLVIQTGLGFIFNSDYTLLNAKFDASNIALMMNINTALWSILLFVVIMMIIIPEEHNG
jgi:hypothetical protein